MSSKRRPDFQVTRENLNEFENEDRDDDAPDVPVTASAEVLAKRKILKPRGRLGGRAPGSVVQPQVAPSSGFNFSFGKTQSNDDASKPNPFATFNTNSNDSNNNDDTKPNPFASFGQTSTAPSSGFNFGSTSQSTEKPTTTAEPSKASNVFNYLNSNNTISSTIATNNNSSSSSTATSLVSTKNSDKPSKIKALNENFYDKITQAKQLDPVSNFTPILRKYIDYYDRIENDLDIPDADQEDEVKEVKALPPVPKQQQALPSSTTTTETSNGAQPSFNFGAVSKPAFSFGQSVSKPEEKEKSEPAFQKEESAEVIDVDDSDSDDDIKVEGPKFTLDKPVTTSDSVFKLSKDSKATSTEGTGPSFTFSGATSKNFDSPFKLSKPETKKEDPKEEVSRPAFSSSSSNNFTWSPGSAIKFGTEDEKKKTDTPPASQFSFGLPAQKKDEPESVKKDEVSKPSFSFGSSVPSFGFGGNTSTTNPTTDSDSSKPSFSFGSTTAASNAATDSAKPSFSFGAPSSGFNFNFSKPSTNDTATTTTTTNNNDDNNDDKVDETEPDVRITPLVELKDQVEEKTGEEDEDVTYVKRSKLQLFNKETNSYDSKGLGELKVLKHKQTGKSRVLVRADGSNRVILNISVVSGIKYETIGKGNLVRIPVPTEGKIDTYLAQVKTPEDGSNLLKALQDGQN